MAGSFFLRHLMYIKLAGPLQVSFHYFIHKEYQARCTIPTRKNNIEVQLAWLNLQITPQDDWESLQTLSQQFSPPQDKTFTETILTTHCLIAITLWGVENQVRQALEQRPGPSTFLSTNCLYQLLFPSVGLEHKSRLKCILRRDLFCICLFSYISGGQL